MILKKLHSPFLFLLLLAAIGCSRYQKDFHEFETYKSKADTLYKKAQIDSAYYYYNLAKGSLKDKEDVNYTYVLLQMASAQLHLSDLFGCEETATKALENPKDSIYKPYIYNVLAASCDRQRRYDEALGYYKKAFLAFNRDGLAKAIAQQNIGLVYREKQEYQKAIGTFNHLLGNECLKHNRSEFARVLDNLGYAQFKINSPEAFSNLSESLRLRDSLHDIIGSIPSYIHLSEFFLNKDKAKSQQYAEQALVLAKQLNTPSDKLESLRWIIKINPNAPGKYLSEYIALDDSLDISRTIAGNKYAKMKYDFTQTQKQKEKAERKTRNITFILITVTLLLLGVIYLVRYLNKQKLKASVYDTERRISKRIHDELANDVFNSLTFAETQDLQDKEKKETFLQGMERIYGKTRNISNENSEIETGEGFEAFLKEMITSYNSSQVTVLIKDNKEIAWNTVNQQKKVAIYRVLQELLVNMKKHSNCRFAVISFEKDNNTIQISYSDNGTGTTEGLVKKNGLRNMENRIKAIKGTITFETGTDTGFKARIRI